MFERIDFSMFQIKRKQGAKQLYVSIRPKENTKENYDILLLLLEEVRKLENDQVNTVRFNTCDLDYDASILPHYLDIIERERVEFQECKDKFLAAADEMDDWTEKLDIYLRFDYEYGCRLAIVRDLEYQAPIEYREQRMIYDGAKVSFWCRGDTEIYNFFKSL